MKRKIVTIAEDVWAAPDKIKLKYTKNGKRISASKFKKFQKQYEGLEWKKCSQK